MLPGLQKSPPHRPRNNTGAYGEQLAVFFLQHHHFRILERNYRAGHGEIDIIAVWRDTLVFVEVKTRISFSFGRPEDAISRRKLREITQTAWMYKNRHPELPSSLRIDVIAIVLSSAGGSVVSLRHIPNITL
ncbi:YraN family protein [Patescibacteria group bacterium]|nr:YraN family protein [Patescibacteria group bacterium]